MYLEGNDLAPYEGSMVVFIDSSNKYGYTGAITGIIDGRIFITFDISNYPPNYEGSRAHSYARSSVKGQGNPNCSKYIKVTSTPKQNEVKSTTKGKEMKQTIEVSNTFNTAGQPQEVQEAYALSLEPEKFYLVCNAEGKPMFRLGSGKKNRKLAAKIAADQAAKSADGRGIFYVMEVLSAHQIEQRPIVETNFDED